MFCVIQETIARERLHVEYFQKFAKVVENKIDKILSDISISENIRSNMRLIPVGGYGGSVREEANLHAKYVRYLFNLKDQYEILEDIYYNSSKAVNSSYRRPDFDP